MPPGRSARKRKPIWFKFGKYSEDLSWCHQARAKGLTIWCNPNVVVGHLGEVQVIGPKEREAFVVENPESIGVQFVPDKPKEQERTPEHHNVVLQEDIRMIPSA